MTWYQPSGMRMTIRRSQIGTFLAGVTSAVICVESRVQAPERYEIRKGFGNTRMLEACELNMKLWNNCVLFIYSMEMILGIQLPGLLTHIHKSSYKEKIQLIWTTLCREWRRIKKPKRSQDNFKQLKTEPYKIKMPGNTTKPLGWSPL